MRRLCAPSGLAPRCGVTHIKIALVALLRRSQDGVMIVIPASFAEHSNRSFRLSTDARVSHVPIKWLRFSIEDVMMMCGHKPVKVEQKE
jgi:hypothetical protein